MNSLLLSASPLSKYVGKTVLAVGAHPDDLELGVGGTLSLLSRCGARVVMVVVCVPNRLEPRVKEANLAAQILGCELRILNEQACSRVEDLKTYELVERVDKLVSQLDPALLISHSDHNFHKDHVLVNHACVAAQRLHFFDFFSFYPTSCHPVNAPFRPQAYVDITATVEDKMKAINVHTSQFTCRGLTTDHYRDTAREYGRLAGVEYAEGLEIVRLSLNAPPVKSGPPEAEAAARGAALN